MTKSLGTWTMDGIPEHLRAPPDAGLWHRYLDVTGFDGARDRCSWSDCGWGEVLKSFGEGPAAGLLARATNLRLADGLNWSTVPEQLGLPREESANLANHLLLLAAFVKRKAVQAFDDVLASRRLPIGYPALTRDGALDRHAAGLLLAWRGLDHLRQVLVAHTFHSSLRTEWDLKVQGALPGRPWTTDLVSQDWLERHVLAWNAAPSQRFMIDLDEILQLSGAVFILVSRRSKRIVGDPVDGGPAGADPHTQEFELRDRSVLRFTGDKKLHISSAIQGAMTTLATKLVSAALPGRQPRWEASAQSVETALMSAFLGALIDDADERVRLDAVSFRASYLPTRSDVVVSRVQEERVPLSAAAGRATLRTRKLRKPRRVAAPERKGGMAVDAMDDAWTGGRTDLQRVAQPLRSDLDAVGAALLAKMPWEVHDINVNYQGRSVTLIFPERRGGGPLCQAGRALDDALHRALQTHLQITYALRLTARRQAAAALKVGRSTWSEVDAYRQILAQGAVIDEPSDETHRLARNLANLPDPLLAFEDYEVVGCGELHHAAEIGSDSATRCTSAIRIKGSLLWDLGDRRRDADEGVVGCEEHPTWFDALEHHRHLLRPRLAVTLAPDAVRRHVRAAAEATLGHVDELCQGLWRGRDEKGDAYVACVLDGRPSTSDISSNLQGAQRLVVVGADGPARLDHLVELVGSRAVFFGDVVRSGSKVLEKPLSRKPIALETPGGVAPLGERPSLSPSGPTPPGRVMISVLEDMVTIGSHAQSPRSGGVPAAIAWAMLRAATDAALNRREWPALRYQDFLALLDPGDERDDQVDPLAMPTLRSAMGRLRSDLEEVARRPLVEERNGRYRFIQSEVKVGNCQSTRPPLNRRRSRDRQH